MRPVCGSCGSLQIACHFGDQKPAWMDGAAEQKKMTQIIKDEIKNNAPRRKERRDLRSQDHEIIITRERDYRKGPASGPALQPPAVIRADTASNPDGGEKRTVVAAPVPPTESMTAGGNSVESTGRARSPMSSADEFYRPRTAIRILHPPSRFPSRDSGATSPHLGREVELGFIMIYLDYVFPFLFPFYRPPLLETGRHWLLSLLCQNEVSFHTAASLSSYFFSVVLQDGRREMQDSCKALVWEHLMGQMDLALKMIQEDIDDINRRGVQAALMESAHILGEIIQLLIMEITVRRNVEWTIHLTPALVLFDDIFKHHGTFSYQPNLDVLLRQMSPQFSTMAIAHSKPLPNTADQSALLFFMAILLFIDIVSSTALDQPPRLQSYHLNLLSSYRAADTPVSLEAFVGCQNWVLLAISDISALNAWKKNAKCAGNLSVIDLVNRAGPISQALHKGLMSLDTNKASGHPMVTAAGRLDGYYSRLEDKTTDHASIATATRIWAHAANIYLYVVLSGWQPASPDVHNSVAEVLTLLQGVESPSQLRSLAWPLCVAGCLALPYQEREVSCIIESMGELGVFGTVSEAQGIVEAVWRSRDTLDRGTWDIAACLRILGSPALLV